VFFNQAVFQTPILDHLWSRACWSTSSPAGTIGSVIHIRERKDFDSSQW